uniref:Inner membrane protein translocon n=1 Tax=Lepidodinium chlorophorum TaxID=107758 RepID=A0A0F7QZR6_LEPCH|nr:inner membrane protein translocon [Lepidodinium chlorophorum]BAR72326.1 inner membrane protein translocon [Lepidodinium chlorophorum]
MSLSLFRNRATFFFVVFVFVIRFSSPFATFFTNEYFTEFIPLFSEGKDLYGYNSVHSNIDFILSWFAVLEIIVMKFVFKLLIFKQNLWKEFIHIPIIIQPIQTQTDRRNFNIFSNIPFVPTIKHRIPNISNTVQNKLNFWVPALSVPNVGHTINQFNLLQLKSGFAPHIFPINAFQHRFSKSILLNLHIPLNIIFFITLRRFWVDGINGGVIRISGYQLGQAVRFRIRSCGNAPILQENQMDIIALRRFLCINILFEPLSFRKLIYDTIDSPYHIYSKIGKKKTLLIFRIYLIYAWTKPIMISPVIFNQTFGSQDYQDVLAFFSYGPIVSFIYGRGMWFAGILFNYFLFLKTLTTVNWLVGRPWFFWQRHYWRVIERRVFTWTVRVGMVVTLSLFCTYGIEHFLIAGKTDKLFERDMEFQTTLSRTHPNLLGIAFLYERTNVLGRDNFNRADPDIVREPWVLGHLSTESTTDDLETTYSSSLITGRNNLIFLGRIEQQLAEWFNGFIFSKRGINTIISTESFMFPDNQNINPHLTIDQMWAAFEIEDNPVIVGDRIIENIDEYTMPEKDRLAWSNIYTEDKYVEKPREYKKNEDFDKDSTDIERISENGATLLVSDDFALDRLNYSTTYIEMDPTEIRRYWGGVGEFLRKHKSSRSIVTRTPVLIYIDIFLNSQTPQKNVSKNISTRQQQREINRAQHILIKYISTFRFYFTRRETVTNPFRNMFSQSQINDAYRQQLVGNLQIVRRLFATFWWQFDNSIPNTSLMRRKLSLDHITLENTKNIFEHEELGKIPSNQSKQQFLHKSLPQKPKIRRNPKKLHPETKPLFIGLDSTTQSLVLYNRFLPIEPSTQMKPWKTQNTVIETSPLSLLKRLKIYYQNNMQTKFTTWPFNIISRRRVPEYKKLASTVTADITRRRTFTSETEPTFWGLNFLSKDRTSWFRDTRTNIDTASISFWINPQSESNMDIEPYDGWRMWKKILPPYPIPEKYLWEFLHALGNISPTIQNVVQNVIYFEEMERHELELEDVQIFIKGRNNHKGEDDLLQDIMQFEYPADIIDSALNDGKAIPSEFNTILRSEYRTSIPGEDQPAQYTGLVWPRVNSLLFTQRTEYHLIRERDFRLEPERALDYP